MAFPVVEEAIESANPTTAATTHTVALPTATTGQLLLIISDKGSTQATVNAHASLTELLDENLANGLYIAYRLMDGTEPASYDLVTSASTRLASIAYRISAARLVAPTIGTTGSGTSATPDPPASAAPGSTQDFLFIAFAGMAGEEADDDTWGNTPPTNYTPSPPRQKTCGTVGTNLGGLILSAERQLNTGSAQDPGTFGVDTSAAWRSQTIMVEPATPQAPAPTALSMTWTGSTATVTVTNNISVAPSALAMTWTGATPSVETPVQVSPSAVAMTWSGAAPSIAVSDNIAVQPSALAITWTGSTSTVAVTDNRSVEPLALDLTWTGNTPAVAISDNMVALPDWLAMTWTGEVPDIALPVAMAPDALELTWTGAVPTVQAGSSNDITAEPTPLELTLTLAIPAVSVTDNVFVQPGAFMVSLVPSAPAVAMTANWFLVPSPMRLTWRGARPKVTATGQKNTAAAAEWKQLMQRPPHPVHAMPAPMPLVMSFATPQVTILDDGDVMRLLELIA